MAYSKKFHFTLLIVVIAGGLLFWRQWQRAATITIVGTPEPLVSGQAYNIPIDKADPVFGNPGAPMTIVEFVDLNNKESLETHAKLYEFVSKNLQAVNLIFKNFPRQTVFDGDSTPVSRLAVCAGAQNKLWQFVAVAADRRPTRTSAQLADIANRANLLPAWRACHQSQMAITQVQNDLTLAARLGLKDVPAIFVNNKKLSIKPDIDLTKMLEGFIAP